MPIKDCPDKKPLYNPETNRCVTDNAVNRRKKGLVDTRKNKTTSTTNKTLKKVCSDKKPLYNPITNRCLTDNALNRKKSGLVDTRKNKTSNTKKTIISKSKTLKRVCPDSKPLYNPITNRCVTDNALNRKKLGLLPKKQVLGDSIALNTPSLPNKSLKPESLDRMIPFNIRQKTFDNIWYGSGLRQLMGLYYLYNKHKSFMCFIPQNVNTPNKRARAETNGFLFTSHKNASESQYNDYMKKMWREEPVFRKKYKYDTLEMRVHSSLNLKELIEKCKLKKKRFFIGYIILEQLLFYPSGKISPYTSAHANSFIYDTKLQTLEIFEPHGELDVTNEKKYGNERNEILKQYFEKNGVNITKMISSADFCPRRRGPQFYDNLSSKKYNNSTRGYCAAWSIFYLDMRLTYPNEDRSELISKILNTFSIFTKEYINEYAKNIIMTTIDNIPFVKLLMSDKERLKKFNDLKDKSKEKKQYEWTISYEIFKAIQSCK